MQMSKPKPEHLSLPGYNRDRFFKDDDPRRQEPISFRTFLQTDISPLVRKKVQS